MLNVVLKQSLREAVKVCFATRSVNRRPAPLVVRGPSQQRDCLTPSPLKASKQARKPVRGIVGRFIGRDLWQQRPILIENALEPGEVELLHMGEVTHHV